MWGIIGGSGFEQFEEFTTIEPLNRSTPFGECSSGFRKVRLKGCEALFLSRHGAKHELLPSDINFRANIYAMKKMGVTKILSLSAIGSLRSDFKPGDLVLPNQYIDRTKSIRHHTFCERGLVAHASLAHPVCNALLELLRERRREFDFDIHVGATYICIEGPNFSTQAESKMYRSLGADIIGMSNYPEYALAREAGMHYLPCCFVTDYDCWDDSIAHVTLQEVINLMKKNNSKAFQILTALLPSALAKAQCGCHEGGFRTSLMTPIQELSQTQREWLEVLRG